MFVWLRSSKFNNENGQRELKWKRDITPRHVYCGNQISLFCSVSKAIKFPSMATPAYSNDSQTSRRLFFPLWRDGFFFQLILSNTFGWLFIYRSSLGLTASLSRVCLQKKSERFVYFHHLSNNFSLQTMTDVIRWWGCLGGEREEFNFLRRR